MAIVLIILGVICALYGVAVMMVGSGTWFFAFWYILGAVLVALGCAVQAGAWDAMPLAALPMPSRSIIKGDAKSASIAAASWLRITPAAVPRYASSCPGS